MSFTISRPLTAVSLVAGALVYLGYLWYKSRDTRTDSPPGGEHPPPLNSLISQQLKIDQVQEKLNNLKRNRLETLEEEEPVSKDLEPKSRERETQQEKGSSVVNSSEVEEQQPKAVFASTDIRYRNKTNSDIAHSVEPPDSIVCNNSESCIAGVDQEISLNLSVKDNNTLSSTENKVTKQEVIMAVEESRPQVSSETKVPDVLSALKDPIGSPLTPPSPHSYSSSPVKSESSEGKVSSCEWSDLIEQDEREMQEFHLDSQVLSSKLNGLDIHTNEGRSGDSGVASPSEEERDEKREKTLNKKKSKSRTQSGEDAGIGSEQGDSNCSESNYEDLQLLAYHFHIPDYLCGKLIGHNGTFIKKLKDDCRVNIILKETAGEKIQKKKPKSKKDQKFGEGKLKVCCIEGTRGNIDKCLDILKEKFYHSSEITFEQVNKSNREGHNQMNLSGSVCLSLAEGVMHDVFVSSIVGGGHVFLQQPYHPTFFALERLDQCMTKVYNQFSCPQVPLPVAVNSVCVAPCDEGWYRCQVVAYDEEGGMCDIKYLDYGGYHSIAANELRQIRTDFLSLPFQAIECYLANINPTDDENVSAFVLEELISQQVVQARMIGTNEQGVPMIHLYRASNGQTTMVNRELVDRRCAQWLETTIVQLDSPLEHPSVN